MRSFTTRRYATITAVTCLLARGTATNHAGEGAAPAASPPFPVLPVAQSSAQVMSTPPALSYPGAASNQSYLALGMEMPIIATAGAGSTDSAELIFVSPESYLLFVQQGMMLDGSTQLNMSGGLLSSSADPFVSFEEPTGLFSSVTSANAGSSTASSSSDMRLLAVLLYSPPSAQPGAAAFNWTAWAADMSANPSLRMNFDVQDFASRSGLGEPVAAEMLIVQDQVTASSDNPDDNSQSLVPISTVIPAAGQAEPSDSDSASATATATGAGGQTGPAAAATGAAASGAAGGSNSGLLPGGMATGGAGGLSQSSSALGASGTGAASAGSAGQSGPESNGSSSDGTSPGASGADGNGEDGAGGTEGSENGDGSAAGSGAEGSDAEKSGAGGAGAGDQGGSDKGQGNGGVGEGQDGTGAATGANKGEGSQGEGSQGEGSQGQVSRTGGQGDSEKSKGAADAAESSKDGSSGGAGGAGASADGANGESADETGCDAEGEQGAGNAGTGGTGGSGGASGDGTSSSGASGTNNTMASATGGAAMSSGGNKNGLPLMGTGAVSPGAMASAGGEVDPAAPKMTAAAGMGDEEDDDGFVIGFDIDGKFGTTITAELPFRAARRTAAPQQDDWTMTLNTDVRLALGGLMQATAAATSNAALATGLSTMTTTTTSGQGSQATATTLASSSTSASTSLSSTIWPSSAFRILSLASVALLVLMSV